MHNLNYLSDLFNKLKNKDDTIDQINFKRIINILNLPIKDISKTSFTFNDLVEYITENNNFYQQINYIKLRNIMQKNNYDDKTIDCILNDIINKIEKII